jgi:tripartite-type tricarboxylate transporter receptor subunit TctC
MKNLLKFLLLLMAGTAFAQPYPSKPIRVLVAFPPGGPVDIIARLLAPKVSESLGQPVVVENKVGASGNVATAEVAKSTADGYTLLAHSSAYAVNPTLFANPGYDPAKDLVSIAVVAQQANIILVNASFPAKSLDELKRAMQKDKLAFASRCTGRPTRRTSRSKVPAPPLPACLAGSRPSAAWRARAPCRTSRPESCAPLPCLRPSACRSFPRCRR